MSQDTASGHGRSADPRWRVALLSVALAGAAATLIGLAPRHPGTDRAFELPWWTLVVAFALAEVLVVHLELRNQAHTLTLAEIPLLLALCFASPASLLAGRLIGPGLLLLVRHRQGPLKLLFNLSLFTAESAVALWIFSVWVGDQPVERPVVWAAGFVAVTAASVVGAAAVALVIRWHGGSEDLGQLALTLGLTLFTNASLAINAALLLSVSRAAIVVLVAIVGLSYLAYRGYVALRQRYDNVSSLFAFTRLVSDAPDPDAVLDRMLVHMCELLRANRAAITLFGVDGMAPSFRSTDVGGAGPSWCNAAQLPRQLREAARGERPTLIAPRGTKAASELALLDPLGAADAMATTLRSGDRIIGVLTVADRTSEVSTFDTDDGRAFATLADHASVALENGRLLERLGDAEARRIHEARHDALTGLLNRVAFTEQLQDLLARRASPDRAVLLVVADLSGFREVNETLGHPAGDRLLVQLGRQLRFRLGPAALLGRLGADEFSWALPFVHDELDDQLEAAAAHVRCWLEDPVDIDGVRLHVSAAVAAAVAPRDGEDAALLLRRADVALSAAKSSGQRLPTLYDPDRDQSSRRRLALAASLAEAVAQQQIAVVFQPKARLADGEVVGVEALARWRHPEHGAVSPDEFITLAERTGLIVDLTLHVLRTSLRQQARWRRAGHDLSVAVNLSTRALLAAELVERIIAIVAEEGAATDRLTLEVTESAMMADPEAMIASLERLAGAGITISIDDFGTGYSSLAYLQRLPAREIKVDKSFVMPMSVSDDAATIVASVIGLAHSLGLAVVAEGIEDGPAWDRLTALGCDLAQGYVVARPMTADALLAWFGELGPELQVRASGTAQHQAA